MKNRITHVDIRIPGGRLFTIREIDGWWMVFDDTNECLYDKGGSYAAAYKFANWYIENEGFDLKGAL